MPSFKTLVAYLRERVYRVQLRRKVKPRDFTIISDDCWGGRVYRDLGMEYTSPTVNVFFYSTCYLKFISDLKGHLNSELTFKEESIYPEANEKRSTSKKFYPIGVLKDVEIH